MVTYPERGCCDAGPENVLVAVWEAVVAEFRRHFANQVLEGLSLPRVTHLDAAVVRDWVEPWDAPCQTQSH